jgi:DDE family transposase
MKATWLWSLWQAILLSMAMGFTRRGEQRFVEWVTGIVVNVEEHTITQSLFAVNRTDDWKALESFAEYGSWNLPFLQLMTAHVIANDTARLWYGYHVWAADDTKVHRSSADVWGTCTFHEYTARCPNRATTVRAHNWVVHGALLPQVDQPAWFLPVAGQIYFRKTQLPAQQGNSGPLEPFRTKNQLLVEMARQSAKAVPGKDLEVFDGGYAHYSVVRPLLCPDDPTKPRIDFITRLRHDAQLFALPVAKKRKDGQDGKTPKWGRRLPPPRQGERWPGEWQTGTAFLYGRMRQVQWKEVLCQWHVLGHDVVVKAVVAQVEGYSKRFTLVTSATELTGLQVVELFCARFRQEDGFRDLKQRLGWEECRAWTRNPIERTTQVLFTAMSAMRLLQIQLEKECGNSWWFHPPWNTGKTRPSVLDLERLFREHRSELLACLAKWLGNEENEKL